MQTLFGAKLEQHALNAASSLACATSGREITYAELLCRVQRCAAWLERARYRPSEVVGITIAEEIPHLVASLALLWLGVPQVILPTRDPISKRLDLAERLGIGHVIARDAQHALPGRDLSLLGPELDEPAAANASLGALFTDPDAPAHYYASSGTTGEPKIYALSQRALAWRAERIAESEQIGSGYRSLTLVPIQDSMAKSRALTSTYLGMTSVFSDSRSSPPLSVQELCKSFRVTCLELSVLQVSSLVHDPSDPQPFPIHTTVYTAGSSVTRKLREQFRSRFGVPLFIHYGAREFGRITSTFPADSEDDLDTVGLPVPWIDLEIVDGEGRALPPGEVGEIRVRSECMTREYYRDPVATSRHFRDGWFYPGDLGSQHSRGAVCLYGRADDMMNLNGIKIFPAEIERVLEEHPAVRAAAAFAKRSAAHGDIPLAAVELHAPAAVDADELLASARERLGVRAPRRIIVLDALPRNAAGKIVKRHLAALFVPGK